MLVRSTAGFSLVECLIANALVLGMLSALAVTSASAISAVQRVAARSDQTLQLGQIHRFLDAAMTHAGMLLAWVAGDTESKVETAWPVPADPCQPPDAAGPLHSWGGLTIIELSEAPCLPGSATGKALYLAAGEGLTEQRQELVRLQRPIGFAPERQCGLLRQLGGNGGRDGAR